MKILEFKELTSTNEYAKEHFSELEDKTVIIANTQTNGHGRLGRKWIDFKDENICMTIILKPFDYPAKIYSNFTQYISFILAKLLEEDFDLNPKIKWPNDILINDKKVAGILAESTIQGQKFLGIALGIGINLNTDKKNLKSIDKPSTSIAIEYGKKIDKNNFIKSFLNKFFLLYDNFIEYGFPYIRDYYIKKSSFLGKEILLNLPNGSHKGLAFDITDNGALVIIENNIKKTYYIGDIL